MLGLRGLRETHSSVELAFSRAALVYCHNASLDHLLPRSPSGPGPV